jgi:hypothetical protein
MLGVRNGWTHTELKRAGGRTWIIEIAARQGGGYTSDMLQAVYGIDPLRTLLLLVTEGVVQLAANVAPRCCVVMKRFVHHGVALRLGSQRIGPPQLVRQEEGTQLHWLLYPSESTPRLLFGPPHNYHNTYAALLVTGPSARPILRTVELVERSLLPRIVDLPSMLAYPLAKLLHLATQH